MYIFLQIIIAIIIVIIIITIIIQTRWCWHFFSTLFLNQLLHFKGSQTKKVRNQWRPLFILNVQNVFPVYLKADLKQVESEALHLELSSAFDIKTLFAFLMWRLRQMATLLLIHHLVLEREGEGESDDEDEDDSLLFCLALGSLLHPLLDLLTPSFWFLQTII